MQATQPLTFSLTVGEWYDYLLGVGLPKASGTFLGYVKTTPQVDGSTFLAFQALGPNGIDGELTFVNPAHILWLRPETFPKELS